MTRTLRSRRFEARLDPETDNLITAAADQLGQSRSAFVVAAARQQASRTVNAATDMTAEQALAMLLDKLDQSQLAACPLLRGLRTARAGQQAQ
ncbi:MAG: DUF1778 domain-containing protein [Propionibacteriaceae bacterium]|nr:DUF1778 domain-containing protein [Propionibacteriaceae bacterium]